MPKTYNLVLLVALVTLLNSCGPVESLKLSKEKQEKQKPFQPKVIYGEDNRLDLYEVDNANLLQLADSTVALMRSYKLQDLGNGTTQIQGTHFGSSYGLCESEPFYQQKTAAFCSGSLVGPDLIMTAGHCIDAFSCNQTRFVFGFALQQQGVLPESVPTNEVYSCAEVVVSEVKSSGGDFAIVRLDREVVGHAPLSLRRASSPQASEELVVIGHPAGLPTKVAGGAQVREVKAEHFVANLDTYGGNSGSAVFNAQTGDIEGILVRGETDFVYQNGCRVSNVCPSGGCQGEDVTLASQVLNFVPALVDTNPRDPASDGGVDHNNNDDTEEPTTPAEVGPYSVSLQTLTDIPDHNTQGIQSQLNTLQNSNDREVEVTVDIQHSWRGDLKVTLVSPSGEEFLLHNREGYSQNDLVKTYSLKKQNYPSGTWTLKVVDLARFDKGQLRSWQISYK